MYIITKNNKLSIKPESRCSTNQRTESLRYSRPTSMDLKKSLPPFAGKARFHAPTRSFHTICYPGQYRKNKRFLPDISRNIILSS